MFLLCFILRIGLLYFDTMFLHKMLLEVYWPMYVLILNNLLDLFRIGPRIRSKADGRALLAASITSLTHNNALVL